MANLLETVMVMGGRSGERGIQELDLFVLRPGIEQVPVTADHYALARGAFLTYGKAGIPPRSTLATVSPMR